MFHLYGLDPLMMDVDDTTETSHVAAQLDCSFACINSESECTVYAFYLVNGKPKCDIGTMSTTAANGGVDIALLRPCTLSKL